MNHDFLKIKERLKMKTLHELHLLFEAGDDEEEDIEKGEEEENIDDGGDDVSDEESDDESPKSDSDDDSKEDSFNIFGEKPELENTIDGELESIFIDFEKTATKRSDEKIEFSESKLSLKYHLLEGLDDEESGIDMETFSNDVARLVKNFTTLVDVDKLIVNKAKKFIITKYGDSVADEFEKMLDDRHGISVKNTTRFEKAEDAPLAQGAAAQGELTGTAV